MASIYTRYLFGIFALLMCLDISGQEFEPVSHTQRTFGVVDWDDNDVVAFGTGLIWMNAKGEIQGQSRLIEGIPSSDFIDAVSDGDGGLWLMTNATIVRMDRDKNAVVVAGQEQFSKVTFREFAKNSIGEVFGLSKSRILKLKSDNSFDIVYEGDPSSSYYKNLAVDDQGNSYVTSYKNFFKISASGIVELEIEEKYRSYQDVFHTKDGKVIILDYKDIYQLEEGKLVDFLRGYQLTRGLKMYTGLFESSDDYWLYANNGNMFHNDNGAWINYTPPTDLKTGNFGEHLYRTNNGDIWMTLRGHNIFRFDGDKWFEVNLDKSRPLPKIQNAVVVNDSIMITRNSKTNQHFTFRNGELVPFDKLPNKKIYNIKGLGNDLFYSDDTGVYQVKNGEDKLIVKGKVSDFAVLDDEIVYGLDKKIFSSKNGTAVEIANNEHFQGWDNIKRAKFYKTGNNEYVVFSNSRSSILSYYNGDGWQKIISTPDNKKFGGISRVVAAGSQVYFSNGRKDVFHFGDGIISRVIDGESKAVSGTVRLITSSDSTVWFMRGKEIIAIRDGVVIKTFSLPSSKSLVNINAIVPVEDNVYHFYCSTEILKLTL